MKLISKILGIIVNAAEKTVWFLGAHAFFLILIFVLIDFILGIFVFYNYSILVENAPLKNDKEVVKFDEKIYKEVLTQLEKREQDNKEPLTINQASTPGE